MGDLAKSEEITCKHCLYFLVRPPRYSWSDVNVYRCRRYPPQYSAFYDSDCQETCERSEFAEVDLDHPWCGEFREKKERV